MISRVLVTSSLIISMIAGYCIWWIEDDIAFTNTWMGLTAFAHLLLWVSVRLLVEGRYLKILTECATLLALSEVIDELVYDPTMIHFNDILLVAIAVGWGLYRRWEYKNAE